MRAASHTDGSSGDDGYGVNLLIHTDHQTGSITSGGVRTAGQFFGPRTCMDRRSLGHITLLIPTFNSEAKCGVCEPITPIF